MPEIHTHADSLCQNPLLRVSQNINPEREREKRIEREKDFFFFFKYIAFVLQKVITQITDHCGAH